MARRELAEPRPRQLAGRLARQCVDVDDAARQKGSVDALPREATGKLTRARLGEFAARQLSVSRR